MDLFLRYEVEKGLRAVYLNPQVLLKWLPSDLLQVLWWFSVGPLVIIWWSKVVLYAWPVNGEEDEG